MNATASAHNTTTAGKNIEVVETPNADGGIDYEVKTKDEVEFNKVTAKKVTGLDAGTADKDAVTVRLVAVQRSILTERLNSRNSP